MYTNLLMNDESLYYIMFATIRYDIKVLEEEGAYKNCLLVWIGNEKRVGGGLLLVKSEYFSFL